LIPILSLSQSATQYKKWLVKRKSFFPFWWKVCTETIETAAGYREFPRWFETSQDAVEWIETNSFIEILVYRERNSLLKERILLQANNDKRERQCV